MGINNTAAAKWLSDKRRFADLFNGLIYQGETVISPEDLTELRNESDFLFLDKNQKKITGQRYRDLIMLWKNEFALSLLACENQRNIHYAMPLRTMLYDSLSYLNQVQHLWTQHQQSNSTKSNLSQNEFLSHFRKEDKLIPIITIVFYYGTEPWDASLDLYGILNLPTHEEKHRQLLKSYIPNYRLNLIDATNEKHLERFQTDLQVLFKMLQCRTDKQKMCNFMNEHKNYFSTMSLDDIVTMSEFLEFPKMKTIIKELKEEQEDPNMCKALEDLYQDGVTDGVLKGEEIKLHKLVEQNYKRGLSIEEIANFLNESPATIEEMLATPLDSDPVKTASKFHERYGI